MHLTVLSFWDKHFMNISKMYLQYSLYLSTDEWPQSYETVQSGANKNVENAWNLKVLPCVYFHIINYIILLDKLLIILIKNINCQLWWSPLSYQVHCSREPSLSSDWDSPPYPPSHPILPWQNNTETVPGGSSYQREQQRTSL